MKKSPWIIVSLFLFIACEDEKTVWINKSATTKAYSNNGSGDLLREEFITVNEFGDWLTFVTKSNNVVQQSITLTYKADRFKPYYTQ